MRLAIGQVRGGNAQRVPRSSDWGVLGLRVRHLCIHRHLYAVSRLTLRRKARLSGAVRNRV